MGILCWSIARAPLLVPSYFQCLDKLTHLDLGDCLNLKYLPQMPGNVEFLNLSKTAIEELPSSVWSHEKISYLDIRFCKDLRNLPSNSCNLKLTSGLSLEGCSSIRNFSELPRDLRVLEMVGTKIEVFPSSEYLYHINTIRLLDCKRLVSLPPSISKLKSLYELDLTGCSEFEDFPEILEPMGHLKILLLNGTAVKELPSSIKCLFALLRIGLKNCKRLVSLPPSICKLKSLKELDLTGCSEFEDLAKFWSLWGELEFLGLERTSVNGRLSSIGNLTGLQKLDLCFCKNLEFVPESIYNLNRLISLRFDGCLILKKLPPFSVGLHSLEELNLSYYSTLEIPDHLLCLTSLRNLDLSGTMIKSIPVNIKQASSLLFLCLINCKSLQSLPEVPLMLCAQLLQYIRDP